MKKEEDTSKTPTPFKGAPKHLDCDEFDLEELAIALSEAKEEKKLKAFIVYKREEQLKGTVI